MRCGSHLYSSRTGVRKLGGCGDAIFCVSSLNETAQKSQREPFNWMSAELIRLTTLKMRISIPATEGILVAVVSTALKRIKCLQALRRKTFFF